MSKFLERLQSLFACFVPKTSSQVGTVYSRDLSSFAAPNGQKVMLFSSTDITQATMPDGIATADGWIYAQTTGVLEHGDKCRWVRV